MNKLLVVFGFTALFGSMAHADMSDSIGQMCEKMKTCAVGKMVEEGDIPPEMIDSMSGMFDGMCKQMLAEHTRAIGNAGLEGKAQSCVDSMLDSSCDELMESQGNFQSPACTEFTEAAEKAGLDTKQ
ncbi:hypothetical protein [Arenicella xantha]|uniref:Uncharacterized protein n=1 Tax=Arenicella xantha TaxID=644221 RepID=A0A395JPX0_9GAMM|nr:hypothetical protein [Arenicella xantha]RBP53694.1 hypothetical protein DFR28_1011082 [Arenicella xantha]